MKNRFFKVSLGISAFLAVFAAASAVVMVLWNWLVPGITGWTAVTFPQAAGLILLCKLLFGGIGRGFARNGRGPHPRFSPEERTRMRDSVRNMSRDERKKYICNHLFGDVRQPEETEHGDR